MVTESSIKVVVVPYNMAPKVVSIRICTFSGEYVYKYIQYGGWHMQGHGTFSEGTNGI